MKPLHQRFQLFFEANESYTFVPTGEPSSAHSLSIDRSSGLISVSPSGSTSSNARRYAKPVYGILGIISLSMSEYVVILTGKELRGRIAGHEIYKATTFDILPLNPNIQVSQPPHPVEGHLLALLRSHLKNGSFLFSYGWDVTRRLQAQWETRGEDERKAFWQVADERFFWNRYLQSRLIESAEKQDLDAYILPIICGTFDIRPAFIQGRHMQFGLLSRRSRFRAGTRYFRRGIDSQGHVANFNETEQFLFVEAPDSSSPRSGDDFEAQLSFVQIRGSIPLYWAEINTMRYKPDLQIMDLKDTADAMKMHLLEQVSTYGDQILVNLVNHKGHEQPVKEAFERYIEELNLPSVRYQYFDFHTECKNMRWHRISLLIDSIADDLTRYGWFHLNATEERPVKVQSGAVRTNCMDNLDRTNVAQAAIAKWTLNQQLVTLGIIPSGASIEDFPTFASDFREIWADHADSISMAYAGSGALKSDFTRTNERTRKGILQDGLKSAIRYLKNNYLDGARQDAFDLFSGAWVPRRGPSSSLFLVTDARPLITRSMPAIAFFSFFMICAGLTLPRTSEYSIIYYFLLWFTLLAVTVTYMVINGIDFVSWPKLLPPTEAIYYNGPGFRSARHGMGIGKGKVSSQGMPQQKTKWNGGKGRQTSLLDEGDIALGPMRKRVD